MAPAARRATGPRRDWQAEATPPKRKRHGTTSARLRMIRQAGNHESDEWEVTNSGYIILVGRLRHALFARSWTVFSLPDSFDSSDSWFPSPFQRIDFGLNLVRHRRRPLGRVVEHHKHRASLRG